MLNIKQDELNKIVYDICVFYDDIIGIYVFKI